MMRAELRGRERQIVDIQFAEGEAMDGAVREEVVLRAWASGNPVTAGPSWRAKIIAVAVFIAAGGVGIRFEAAEPPQRQSSGENSVVAPGAETAPASSDPAQATADVATDRYGDPLPERASLRFGTVRFRHSGGLSGVCYSPDGSLIASFGFASEVQLWDAATGRPVRMIGVDASAVSFSPDGEQIATAGSGGAVQMWDVATGRALWSQQSHGERGLAVTFFPDGHTLATSGSDGTVRLWDVASSEELMVLRPTEPPRHHLPIAVSPDGARIACGSNQSITIYDLDSGSNRVIPEAHGGVNSIAFTPDGRFLASGGRSNYFRITNDAGRTLSTSSAEVRLWNADDGELVRRYESEKTDSWESVISLSNDGRFIASCHRDNIRVWDVATGKIVQTMTGFSNRMVPMPSRISISPDAQSVAMAGPDSELVIFDIPTCKRVLSFPDGHRGAITSLDCSPDSKLIVSSSRDGNVRLWDAGSGEMLRVLSFNENASGAVNDIEFLSDGTSFVATGDVSDDRGFVGVTTAWTDDGRVIWTKSSESRGRKLTESPDGRSLLLISGHGDPFGDGDDPYHAAFHDSKTGELIRSAEGLAGDAADVAFTADDRVGLVGQYRESISLWGAASGEKIQEFLADPHEDGIRSAAFSHDGQYVVTSGVSDNLVIVWDLSTGKEWQRFDVGNTPSGNVVLSPNGSVLVSAPAGRTNMNGQYDSAVRFWDVSSGEQLGYVHPGPHAVSALAFTVDGRHLITGMENGTLLLWEIPERTGTDR